MPPNVRIKHVVTRSYSPRRGWRERTSLTINTDLREGADEGSEEEKEEEEKEWDDQLRDHNQSRQQRERPRANEEHKTERISQPQNQRPEPTQPNRGDIDGISILQMLLGGRSSPRPATAAEAEVNN